MQAFPLSNACGNGQTQTCYARVMTLDLDWKLCCCVIIIIIMSANIYLNYEDRSYTHTPKVHSNWLLIVHTDCFSVAHSSISVVYEETRRCNHESVDFVVSCLWIRWVWTVSDTKTRDKENHTMRKKTPQKQDIIIPENGGAHWSVAMWGGGTSCRE